MSAAPDVTILGGGSWGTALALHLSRSGRPVALWVHDERLAGRMASDRVNDRYLPGHPLADSVTVTSDLREAAGGSETLLLAVPSHHCRQVVTRLRGLPAPRAALCVASKGIENDTLLTVMQVAGEVLSGAGSPRLAVLSGPSFAAEVAAGHPTAVVVASESGELAARLQRILSSGNLRVYTNDDPIGVELGGALKNVVAIGAGAVEGLGYGANTLAALITRGLSEIGRLAVSLGGRRETMAGLAGLGDLVLTCTGSRSRNRSLGVALARGVSLSDHLASTPMVAEGVRTTLSAHRLASRQGVDMPITRQVHAILYEGKSPGDAIRDLLARDLKGEG